MCQAVQDLMKKGAEDVTVEYILSIMDHLHISEVEEVCQLLSIPEDRWDMYRELVEKALAEKEDT